ncbi:MAG: Iron-sulfur cluster carrier protein [Candidatus Argoarchaeum ethanivorans]|uniref:Iron-sulfur cluster carrier protein n=1 Tax=Candidatus Argoarchaeum ethanivorans TaxID=2608793 RepID=A0A811T8Y0_9EURY|nr:MAG: Iron-sulfur cluster carrier protein [Candidatus Argoarchaeum ethanivorans]
MIISIASGKGGTGKTTVAVNLALSLSNVQLLDCDVEEPNAHIFLKPEIKDVKSADVLMPEVNNDLCDYCGKCASACEYNAIVVLPTQVMVFPELCHGCGLCRMVCPRDAISEMPREIGVIKRGRSGNNVELVYGLLNIGEGMATPLIDQVKEHADPGKTVIIDAPPGTACPVIAAVSGSDYCILVTEPTPFGLYDLKLIVEVLKVLKIPSGVIVNKAGIGDKNVYNYCEEEGIPILLEIPYDKKIAEYYSEGLPFVNAIPEWKTRFSGMIDEIGREL